MLKDKAIDDGNFAYFTPTKPRLGQSYPLPKVRKSGSPGRPKLIAINHPCEKISQFIDFHLQSHVAKLPSFMKNTTDYLKKTPHRDLPQGTQRIVV